MADNYFNNSVYSVTKPGRNSNYEDSIYSANGQRRTRSMHSARTGASMYSHITKKSSDFLRTDTSSYDKKVPITQRIGLYLWNPDEGTVMGRQLKDWLFVILYYIAIYGAVALVWAASFAFFDFAVLDEDRPTRFGQHSVLQMNPSLSYYPQPDHYSTLIRFRSSRLASIRKYVDDLVAVTQWYEDYGMQNINFNNENVEDCTKKTTIEEPERTICRYNLDVGRRCNAYKNFGFADGEPCFALKMNRIYGWVPDPMITSGINATGALVRCRGRTKTDQDFIGRICYHYTTNGWDGSEDYCKTDYGVFEHFYFPYLRQMRYMSPLVFVEFQGLARNVVVMVECELEAKNIIVDKTYRIGMVQFELLVD